MAEAATSFNVAPFSRKDFLRESLRIEGIHREPTDAEMRAQDEFMALPGLFVEAVVKFVSVIQPGAQLRSKRGLDVRVGNYLPPRGSAEIPRNLQDILNWAHNRENAPTNAYAVHQAYEHLHPFTDGNGRSGRMIWLWMMREAPLGFLHTWYYQSLQNHRGSK